MIGLLKYTTLFALLCASTSAFWWGTQSEQQQVQSVQQPVRQFPVSYIRAFAYQPVAFPQPLAPVTTYHVSKNPQNYGQSYFPKPGMNGPQYVPSHYPQPSLQPPNVQAPTTSTTVAPIEAISPIVVQQPQVNQNIQSDYPAPSPREDVPHLQRVQLETQQRSQPSTQQVHPQIAQNTPNVQNAPNLPNIQIGGRHAAPYYQQGHQQPAQFVPITQFGQQYSREFGQFNPYSHFNGQQFGNPEQYGRNFGTYGHQTKNMNYYTVDPSTYQFIPTNYGPYNQQNGIQFVPCMCPVAVNVSPDMGNIAEKRVDEASQLQATETERATVPKTEINNDENV